MKSFVDDYLYVAQCAGSLRKVKVPNVHDMLFLITLQVLGKVYPYLYFTAPNCMENYEIVKHFTNDYFNASNSDILKTFCPVQIRIPIRTK